MKYYPIAAYVGCILILCRNAESFVCRVRVLHAVPTSQHRQREVFLSITTTAASNDSVSSNKSESGECYYRRIDGPWRPRRELHSLFIGERLFATRLPSCDLLEGKTGPKVFLECGVGRKSKGGKWNIVNGMLRIGKRGMKPSVARKKVKKRMSDSLVEVYVSKLWLDHGGFEVCLSREEALSSYKEKKIPCSSLKQGEILSGKVKHIKDYGVFVDVGANVNPLLHISRITGRAIDNIRHYVNEGDSVPVHVIDIDVEKKTMAVSMLDKKADQYLDRRLSQKKRKFFGTAKEDVEEITEDIDDESELDYFDKAIQELEAALKGK